MIKRCREKKSPWFVYWNPPYCEDDFVFLDNPMEIPELVHLEENKNLIKRDISEVFTTRRGQLVHHFLKSMHDDNGWETLSFINWGIPIKQNLELAPAIREFIESNTGVLSFSINKLKAGKVIKPHTGDTNAIYRIHYGIDIPDQLPICGFRVKNEERPWKNDEFMVFCDAYNHEAWNYSNRDRIIISLDIIRPEFAAQRKVICLKVRSFLLFQLIAEKIPIIKKLPKAFHRLIFLNLLIILFVLYPYQKRHGMILKHS
jgi:ornithine lipid ester-linked acyl 2-hydroxylase